jgi:predicted nucleic acid-binding Zn finger protein
MEILRIKRSRQEGTGLKVYGAVVGDSGKTYNFGYFRRPTFRGWICSCESFILSMFAKKRNCKHIRFVRQQVGRYAATVQN